MISISDELRKIISDGNLQGFYKGLSQSGEAVIIALESIAKRIISDEEKISELEEEIKSIKTQHDCLEKRFQEKFPY